MGHRRVGHVAPIELKFRIVGFSRVLNSMVMLFRNETAAELLELDGVACQRLQFCRSHDLLT